jgi:hypothetical protein
MFGDAIPGLRQSIEEYGSSLFGVFIVFSISREQIILDLDESRLTFWFEADEESGAWDIMDCRFEMQVSQMSRTKISASWKILYAARTPAACCCLLLLAAAC